MDLAGYVINAVLVEGRSPQEVASAHDVSRSWLYEFLARYRECGEEGLRPQSKRPKTSPTRMRPTLEDEILALRKSLAEQGLDAGPHTIRYHLSRRHRKAVPSVATIWRALKHRGFIKPSPTSGLAAPGVASRPSCPTSAGRPTRPTGRWPTAATWRC
jgi:transposase